MNDTEVQPQAALPAPPSFVPAEPYASRHLSTSTSVEAPPPRLRTPARLQAYFLRRLMLSGSQAEAAARSGVTPRTIQRWRTTNRRFAIRYQATLARRAEMLEDRAMERACGIDRRAVFHRGKQVATVDRHNDVMLMRVLAHFDRLRERAAGRPLDIPPVDLRKLTTCELLKLAGWPVPPGVPEDVALVVAHRDFLRRMESYLSRLSPSERQQYERLADQSANQLNEFRRQIRDVN